MAQVRVRVEAHYNLKYGHGRRRSRGSVDLVEVEPDLNAQATQGSERKQLCDGASARTGWGSLGRSVFTGGGAAAAVLRLIEV